MGSVRPRGKYNHLVIDFRYQGMRCREQTLLEDTPVNRKKLTRVLLKIEKDIAQGVFEYSAYFPNSKRAMAFKSTPSKSHTGTPLFKDFAELWLEENKQRWKRSVWMGYKRQVHNQLVPHFGHYEIGAITKADVLAYRAGLFQRKGNSDKAISPSTINNNMKALRGILTEAADRFDMDNAVKNIKKLCEPKKDINPFSLDEVMLLCREIRKDYQNYLLVRFFTGMRTGEIDGLLWKYVDFEHGVLSIREAVVMGRAETPKTRSSYRDIQMSPLVRKALQDQKKYTGDGELVFCNSIGQYIYHNNFRRRVWGPLLRRLNLEYRRPYETRHTAATMWLASGENPEWVARQLGHTNTEMLFRTYSRYIPNLTRQDGSAFDRFLASNGLAGDADG